MEMVDIALTNYTSPSFGVNLVHLGPVGANTIAETEEIEHIEELLLMGKQSLDENNVKSAIKFYSEALEIDTKNSTILVARANAYILDHQYEKAVSDANLLLNTFYSEKSVQNEALMIIVRVHQERNQNESALEYALKLLLLDPENFSNVDSLIYEICEDILKTPVDEKFIGSSFFGKLQNYASRMFTKRKLTPAQRLVECLIHLESSVPQEILARALLTGARIMKEQSSLERAIATYQECILRAWKLELVATECEARFELACVFHELKDFFQAASSFEKCLCLIELIEIDAPSVQSFEPNRSDIDLLRRKIDTLTLTSECYIELNELDLAQSNADALLKEKLVLNEISKTDVASSEVDIIALSLDVEARHNELLCRIMRKKRNFLRAHRYAQLFLKNARSNNGKLYEALLLNSSIERKLKIFPQSLEILNEALTFALKEVETTVSQKSKALERLCITLYNLGKLNLEMGDVKSSIKYLEDCVKQSRKVGQNRDLECKALTLLGKSQSEHGELAQAIHNFNHGLAMQSEVSPKVYRFCMVEAAISIQHLGSKSELEKSRALLEDVIDEFHEEALHAFVRDSGFDNKQFRALNDVSNAYINILVRLGHLQAALLACESFRRFKFCAYFSMRSELNGGKCEKYRNILKNKVTVDFFNACMAEQTNPVLYFHMSESALYVWILSASKGVQSFHKHTFESSEKSMFAAMEEYYNALASRNTGLYGFENRIILNSKSLVRNLPKMDSAEIERRVEKDIAHFIFEAMKPELKKFQSARKLILLNNGLLILAPFSQMLKDYWEKHSLSDKCPAVESFGSVQMMHWIQYSQDEGKIEPFKFPLNEKLDHSEKVSDDRLRRFEDPMNLSRSGGGTTANLLGWTNLSEGLGTNSMLKEVPSLQYRRQIQSAGGDKADLSSMYKGINPTVDKLGSDQNTIIGLPYGLDNESLRTDVSSLKHAHSLSSGKAGRQGTTKTVLGSSKNLKDNNTTASPVTNQESDNVSVSQISSEESKGSSKAKTMRKIEQSFSTLISKTWNEKHVRHSRIAVESYSPGIRNSLFRFIGAPVLPTTINFHSFTWKPLKCLQFAQNELKTCSHYFRDHALMGEKCTKNDALHALVHCKCIHIATHANYDSCELAFTPLELYQKMKCIDSEACCVSLRDLLDLDLSHVKLVVLSAFPSQKHHEYENFFNLATLLHVLGVQCVVYSSLAVLNESAAKFWHYFYRGIRKIEPKCTISAALDYAKSHMQKDAKFSSPENWKGFQFTGMDVEVDGKGIIHDMLDQVVDKVEQLDSNDYFNAALTKKHQDLPLLGTSEGFMELRKLFVNLMMENMNQLDILDSLFYLVLRGFDHCMQNTQNTDLKRLDNYKLIEARSVLLLLHFLRFDFQPYGCTDNKEDNYRPIILFPHWDKNSLLKPACEVLRNLILIRDNVKVLEELCAVLRFDSSENGDSFATKDDLASLDLEGEKVDLVSLVIDILALSEHAPDVQMFISDAGMFDDCL